MGVKENGEVYEAIEVRLRKAADGARFKRGRRRGPSQGNPDKGGGPESHASETENRARLNCKEEEGGQKQKQRQ